MTDGAAAAPAKRKRKRKRSGKAKRKERLPTMRLSREYLESQGYLVDDVERRIPHTFITKDLYGFIDLLACRRGEVLGVQTCRLADVATRVSKITHHENVGRVREAGIRIVVHGWSERVGGYRLREVDVS